MLKNEFGEYEGSSKHRVLQIKTFFKRRCLSYFPGGLQSHFLAAVEPREEQGRSDHYNLEDPGLALQFESQLCLQSLKRILITNY